MVTYRLLAMSHVILALLICYWSIVCHLGDGFTTTLPPEAGARCPGDWLYFHGSCYAFLDDVAPFSTAKVK